MSDPVDSTESGGKKRKPIRPPGMGKVIGTPMLEGDEFHVKRVEASFVLPDLAPIPVRALLNDLSERGLAIYVPQGLHLGSKGKLILPEPRAIELASEVVWCQELERGRNILAAQSFAFRIGLRFEFASEEEAQKLKQFCEELSKAYPGRDLTGAPYASAA
jgi:hypothetical protein